VLKRKFASKIHFVLARHLNVGACWWLEAIYLRKEIFRINQDCKEAPAAKSREPRDVIKHFSLSYEIHQMFLNPGKNYRTEIRQGKYNTL
jgi:hypothetical protein